MFSDVAIAVKNLSKCYQVYNKPQDRLKQAFWGGRKQFYQEFWALHDVSFEVKKGQALGIIGRNGSGKSTLLQLICGTLTPTAGEIIINGKIAALLELGAGFNPEFTGRENVFMNGAILGFSKQEIDAKFDEIAAFADIGKFIDQPVKTYSSGMYVRLAFAVQACVEPDILIVDEALSVGDIFFQQKCYQRLNKLRDHGSTIIFVSHAMNDIEQFCQQAVLLHHGVVVSQGPSVEVVKQYYLLEQHEQISDKGEQLTKRQKSVSQDISVSNDNFLWPNPEAFLDISNVSQISNGWARCIGVAICDDQGNPCLSFQQGETAHFFYEFELLQDIEVPIGGIVIQNDKGWIVHGKHSLQSTSSAPLIATKGESVRFRQSIMLEVAVGEYTFEVGLASMSSTNYKKRASFSHMEFNKSVTRICHLIPATQFAVTMGQYSEFGQLPFYGIANLQGACHINIKSCEIIDRSCEST